MGSELNIATTERELAYRSKNYSDLKASEKRELFCSSCGNILSHDSRRVFSHPIFGILQCENCKNHFKTVTFSLDKDDSVRNCHICGRERPSSYGCVNSNCPYEFCKTCIKRNVPQSLVDAESGKWKCFACNPKPLWKLRGACAAVMSSLPKRTKSKKVKSRESSSDREDERSSLKDRSYVSKTQLKRNNRLSKKLSSLCDNDSPNSLEESHQRTTHRSQGERASVIHGNAKINNEGKFVRIQTKPGRVTRLASSEDSDIEEIVPLAKKKMVKTKFHRENSPERSKLHTREKESRNDSVGSKKSRGQGRKIGGDVSESENSSDDSDVEEMKSRMSSKRTSDLSKRRAKVVSRNSHKEVSSDSSSDDSVTASLKLAMPTAFAKKPKTVEKTNSTSSKRRESSEDTTRSSATKSVKKQKLRGSESPDREATVSESNKRSFGAAAQDVGVIFSNIANVIEKNSRKTYGQLRLARSKPGSDSSSSKEFRSSKIHKSGHALHRFQDVEEDFTMSPCDDSKDNPNDEISKQQSFALKKSVRNFLAELKTSATKLLVDIDQAQKTYFPKDESMRESMKPSEANCMILDTKRVLGTWKDCVRQNETKITDYYDGWCKKTRQRNVWRSPRVAERATKNKANPTDDSGSESSESSKIASDKKESRVSSPESVVANGDKPVVSDCDSEEIFSNDEARMSISRNNAATPDGEAHRTTSADVEIPRKRAETKNRGSGTSSDEREATTEETVTEKPTKTASPTMSEFSGHTEADEPASKAASPVDRNERESMNASPDIFETSVESDSEKKLQDRDANSDEKMKKKLSPKGRTREAKSKASVSDSDSESEASRKSSSRAAGQESDNAKKASSRAASPASVESDDSKRAPSHLEKEPECSKDASSRPASPTSRQTDDSTKTDSRTPGSEDFDKEKCEEVTVPESSDKNSEAAFSEAETEEFINPLDSVEAFMKEKDDESGKEDTRVAEIDSMSVEKSTEKIVSSDPESIATELNLSPSVERSHSLPDTTSKSTKKTSRATETSEEKKKREKSPKKREKMSSKKRCDSSIRSSSNTETDDLDGSAKNLQSEMDSGSSSDLSDADNARAKEAMLISSNSDDSSAEHGSRTRNSNPKESNDSPLTPPESDSKSGRSSRSPEITFAGKESENEQKNSDSEKPRKKRKKFRLSKNRFYIADEKLRKNCEVQVKRLKESVLEKYSRALRKSRKHVESKEIERLLALDNLEKKTKKAASSSSEDEDSTKTLTRNKKKTRAKEPEETLMDHLKKVENGANIVESSESDDESSKSEKKNKVKENGDDNLFEEANRMAKKRMLDSSESAAEEHLESDAKEEEVIKKTKKVVEKENTSKSSEDDEKKKEKAEKAEKRRWRKNKILTLKISDTDSDKEREKFDKTQDKLASQKRDQGSDSDEEEEESSAKRKTKKRVRRRVLHSDSDADVSPMSNSDSDSSIQNSKKKKDKNDSDGDDGGKKKARKRTRRSRSSDSSMDEARPKPTRRKRIKAVGTDSDSDDVDKGQGSPGKTGRKNIRKVLRDKQVAADTKQAAKEEEERLKRIAERQKLYNEMYEVRLAGEQKVDKLVLDFDEETKEPLVSVDEGLVKRLKPHQAQGIKFMWDACFESLERTKNTKGSGCILAHCMGLGKSFQIVTLAHTLLLHPETGIKTVLVVCPLSTVLNWANEFKIWLADLPSADDIEIYEMTKMKKIYERKYQLEHWQKTGGVMIIGYEMFRNLSSGGKKVRKNVQESFIKSLVDPGPDLIVCDEGHLLKKEATALSKAMTKVRTLRRIVLTGTPLQNNLIEYHCMVQFVKPALLGTKREFMNRFENPITNGQFDDSTEYDVKLMKKRAHVLHKMLEGSVQRFDYSVLTPFLPPKQEYVIFVKLTDIQIKMYQHYLENYARRHRGVGGSLFADFQALQRIWTHPMVMQMNAEKNEKKRLDASDSEGSLKDFIDDGSETPCSSDDSDVQSASGSDDEKGKKKTQRSTRANPVVDDAETEPTTPGTEENNEAWWTQFIKSDDDYEDIRISSKLLLLFRILKECEQIGDKVLVFSQSLYSLTLIEKFLEMIDDETQKGNHPDHLDGHSGNWALGLDYFRLDGQSSADNRRLWCNVFNRPSNTRARLFLISTRAGGLGINLTAANRVVIFDASWNPSHDVQSIFRIYRFGQKKPCYVYRLLAAGTMEEKIYNRQVTKLSLSCRVVDEQQIERHYTNNALAELYKLELPSGEETTLNLPKDRLLAEIFLKYKHTVETYHEHDSLLENQAGEELDEEERQQAWLEYEEEKKGRRIGQPMQFMTQDQLLLQQINMMNLAQQQNIMNNPAMIEIMQKYQGFMQKDYPGLPEAQHKLMATKALYDMYNSVERQTVSGQRPFPMMNIPTVGQFGYDAPMQTVQPIPGHPSMDTLRMYQQSLAQAQAQNGHLNNYSNNQGHMRDNLGLPRQAPMAQIGQITGMSGVSSSIDDDIVEIPSSPERNPVPSGSAPSGSGKSKEE